MKTPTICKNNPSLLKETARYLDRARQIPRVRAFFWLLRCADALDRYASQRRGRGQSRTMISVLQILIENPGGISQQSIAQQTGRTKQLVVTAIDRLEKKGWVVRNSHVSDRRINSICITDAGIKQFRESYPNTVEMCNRALSSLNEAELEQMIQIVIKTTKSVWETLGPQYTDKTYGQPDSDKY
jgi:DNA-binding MarR family transcriptional regulator